MKIEELLHEGMWVIKNKDGKEKRFKDDKSSAALAWKDSSSPKRPSKKKAEKYTYDWWMDSDADVLPWDKIEDVDNLYKYIKGGTGVIREPDDWTFGGSYRDEVDGVPVAGRKIRLMYLITKDDDLGIDDNDGEGVEHSETIGIVRDVKNPKKFVFDGFK